MSKIQHWHNNNNPKNPDEKQQHLVASIRRKLQRFILITIE